MKSEKEHKKHILLVEDNPGDIRLIKEAFINNEWRQNIYVVEDGVEALAFLGKKGKYVDSPRPDLVLLDLNLPKKDGYEVLEKIKTNEYLKVIPVLVLTTSSAETDIQRVYKLQGNCYITKPADLYQFNTVIQSIEKHWLEIVSLPQNGE